jgi:hypothetical protein
MKKVLLGIMAVAGVAAVALLGTGALKFGVNSGTCQVDGEVDTSIKSGIASAAMPFAEKMITGQVEEDYASTTDEVRASIPASKFALDVKAFVIASGPFSDLKVEHTYFVQSSGTGPEARTVCGPLDKDDWVAVNIKPGLTQAHVVMSAQTRNNSWAVTLWLLQVGQTWRVQYFNISMSQMVGISAAKMLDMAQTERKAGHDFNASMLYVGAQSMTSRGPAFQLGLEQTLRKDLEDFKSPPELSGKPPFDWVMNGHAYRVGKVTILGVDKKLGLVFELPQTDWKSNEDAALRNHAFVDAFVATHPDSSRVISFLVARAIKPDHSGGFGTVYEYGKGYH